LRRRWHVGKAASERGGRHPASIAQPSFSHSPSIWASHGQANSSCNDPKYCERTLALQLSKADYYGNLRKCTPNRFEGNDEASHMAECLGKGGHVTLLARHPCQAGGFVVSSKTVRGTRAQVHVVFIVICLRQLQCQSPLTIPGVEATRASFASIVAAVLSKRPRLRTSVTSASTDAVPSFLESDGPIGRHEIQENGSMGETLQKWLGEV